ncbi:MAG: hypothetical protein L6R40_005578 [Gallowayella cf. fulva]|nr:MAG: hypothetical protein L6R40_005578 [Xanthomendoza cf. fulva]
MVAAPLDALAIRFRPADMLGGRYRSMWHYGYFKVKEIGIRGVLAGWSLFFVKETLGYGLFFAIFEYTKAQSYYAFVTRYYGGLKTWDLQEEDHNRVIRPHYAIEPSFLLLAGIAASIAQQIIHHPFSLIQKVHYMSLAVYNDRGKVPASVSHHLRTYFIAYQKTIQSIRARANQLGGWRRWLYRGFFWNTIRRVPSTSAGLIIIEIVRRQYGVDAEAAHIGKDGYDIILR